MKSPGIFAAVALALSVGAFLAPGAPFIVDGGIYYDMARAMAENDTLFIAHNGGVAESPALTKHLTVDNGGLVYPQYPSGYAYIAAPFYALFGIHGLMLINALAFAVAIWLTFACARMLVDARVARWSCILFSIASFAPTYAFGIWPHMLALAFWLGAISCAICATRSTSRSRRLLWLLFSGVLIGAGLNVRVDVFLAGLVVFFWLRLFALPQDRLAPLLVMVGMTPGLLAAAWLNYIKFGDPSPFSYGSDGGADHLGRYFLIASVAAAALIGAWVLNIPHVIKIWMARDKRLILAALLCIVFLASLVVAPVRELIWRIGSGLYVLVLNLQAHNAYHQDGVEPNSYGQLLFWGYPKKALIQSIPWMVLAAIPVFSLRKSNTVKEVGLCGLAVAAPLCFYALSHWHGGGSYSMRYFLPAVPFLAILSANGLVLILGAQQISRQTLLAVAVGAGVLYLGLQEAGQAHDRIFVPAALYVQWIIALLICALLVMDYFRPSPSGSSRAALPSLFAIAYAVSINLYEEAGHERTRAEQSARAEDLSAPLPTGSLVVTTVQTSLIPAERRGVNLIAIDKKNGGRVAQAVTAFSAAGACVYFHNSLSVDLAKEQLADSIDQTPVWAKSEQFPGDPRLAFFTLSSAPDACRAAFS